MPGHYDDNVFFIGDFDDALEQSVLVPLTKEIENQANLREGRIDLYINSYGGYGALLDHMVELVEMAKREDVTVRTIVPSVAFSAGSMLAITGTPGERYIGRNAEHLIHYGQIASFETTPKQVERFSKWKDRSFKRNLAHYKKYCNVPDIDSEMMDEGFFVVAKDAIRWGMADHFTDKLRP